MDAKALPAVEDPEKGNGSGEKMQESFASLALHVPHRLQLALACWCFFGGSSMLILEFASLQDLLSRPTELSDLALLVNWIGVICFCCWVTGFVILTHWMFSIGATRISKLATVVKLIGAVFFHIAPMTGTMNDPRWGGGAPRGGGAGTWWSAFVGIVFFHTGTLLSTLDLYVSPAPAPAQPRARCVTHGDLPVIATWTFQLATWFLIVGIFLSCPFKGASWAPVLALNHQFVVLCQFVGSILLLAGSSVFLVFCDGFRNLAHRQAA